MSKLPTIDEIMLELDEAEAGVRNAKHALRPESLASEPDWNSFWRSLSGARVNIKRAWDAAQTKVR